VTAPTQLDELEDDLAVPADVGAPWGHTSHRWAFREGRWIHRAGCPCWSGGEASPAAAAESCRYCRKDHDVAGVCRWARWLRRG